MEGFPLPALTRDNWWRTIEELKTEFYVNRVKTEGAHFKTWGEYSALMGDFIDTQRQTVPRRHRSTGRRKRTNSLTRYRSRRRPINGLMRGRAR